MLGGGNNNNHHIFYNNGGNGSSVNATATNQFQYNANESSHFPPSSQTSSSIHDSNTNTLQQSQQQNQRGIGSPFNEPLYEPTFVDQLGVTVPANLNELKEQIGEQVTQQYAQLYSIFAPPEKPPQFKFTTVNFYSTLNEPEIHDLKTTVAREKARFRKALKNINSDFKQFLVEFLRVSHNTIRRWIQKPFVAGLLFLLVLSFLSAISSVLIDLMTVRLVQARVKTTQLATTWWGQYLIWIGYGLAFALLSESCVRYISPFIVGSGMADMKTMISGIVIDKVLDVRAMVGKFLGIATTMSAGFTVGRVGPFIHITACMGHQLLKLRVFKRINQNDFIRTNMLCAAIAVACAATFGTPVGAVLFAVEISTTYFLVSNLWKVFVASLFGAGFFYLARQIGIFPHSLEGVSIALYPTNFHPFPYKWWEYAAFAFIGVILGLLGGLFLKILARIVKIRNRFKILREARYTAVFVVCVALASIDWWIPLANMSSGSLFHRLFGNKEIESTHGDTLKQLIILFVFKYFATLFSLTLPIPNGVTVQSWVMGACVARIIGELLKKYVDINVHPAGYAVVGACTMSVSITKALSMIVIVLESTGQPTYTIPCFLAAIIAKAVASTFTTSIYEMMIKLRNMPCLILTNPYLGQNIMAVNIMKSKVDFVTTEDSLRDIHSLLQSTQHPSFPICDNRRNKILIGEASRETLERMIMDYQDKYAQKRDGTQVELIVSTPTSTHEQVEVNPFDIELQEQQVAAPQTSRSPSTPEQDQHLEIRVNDNGDMPIHPYLDQMALTHEPVAVPTLHSIEAPATYVGDIIMDPNMIDTKYEQESAELRSRISRALSDTKKQPNTLTPELAEKLHDSGEVIIHAAKYIVMNKKGKHEATLEIDPAPFCINELTSLNKIQYLYSMLGLGQAWVVSQSKLKGVLTKRDLINASKELERYLEE